MIDENLPPGTGEPESDSHDPDSAAGEKPHKVVLGTSSPGAWPEEAGANDVTGITGAQYPDDLFDVDESSEVEVLPAQPVVEFETDDVIVEAAAPALEAETPAETGGDLFSVDDLISDVPVQEESPVAPEPTVAPETPVLEAQPVNIEEPESDMFSIDDLIVDEALDQPISEPEAISEPEPVPEPEPEPLAVEQPAVEPTLEETANEEHAFEAPVLEEPALDVPAFEEPALEEPAFEEPVFEEPAFEEPAFAEALPVESPVAEQPDAEVPEFEPPLAVEPEVPAEPEPFVAENAEGEEASAHDRTIVNPYAAVVDEAPEPVAHTDSTVESPAPELAASEPAAQAPDGYTSATDAQPPAPDYVEHEVPVDEIVVERAQSIAPPGFEAYDPSTLVTAGGGGSRRVNGGQAKRKGRGVSLKAPKLGKRGKKTASPPPAVDAQSEPTVAAQPEPAVESPTATPVVSANQSASDPKAAKFKLPKMKVGKAKRPAGTSAPTPAVAQVAGPPASGKRRSFFGIKYGKPAQAEQPQQIAPPPVSAEAPPQSVVAAQAPVETPSPTPPQPAPVMQMPQPAVPTEPEAPQQPAAPAQSLQEAFVAWSPDAATARALASPQPTIAPGAAPPPPPAPPGFTQATGVESASGVSAPPPEVLTPVASPKRALSLKLRRGGATNVAKTEKSGKAKPQKQKRTKRQRPPKQGSPILDAIVGKPTPGERRSFFGIKFGAPAPPVQQATVPSPDTDQGEHDESSHLAA